MSTTGRPRLPANVPASETKSSGIRAGKKERTRKQLQLTAQELVLRQGFAATRLEDICSRANVAPRTFVNYFVSKEDAVMGRPSSPVPAAVLETHRCCYGGAEPAEAVIGLLMLLLESSSEDPSQNSTRNQILQSNPELFTWQLLQIWSMREELLPFVTTLLRHGSMNADQISTTMVHATLVLCIGAVHSAFANQLDTDNFPNFTAVGRDATAAVRAIVTLLESQRAEI